MPDETGREALDRLVRHVECLEPWQRAFVRAARGASKFQGLSPGQKRVLERIEKQISETEAT